MLIFNSHMIRQLIQQFSKFNPYAHLIALITVNLKAVLEGVFYPFAFRKVAISPMKERFMLFEKELFYVVSNKCFRNFSFQ